MSNKQGNKKRLRSNDEAFAKLSDVDFPEQKLNQILDTLPSFISENKPAYLVGEIEYDDYSEKIDTINQEEEFNDFLHHALNKKYHYEALSDKEKINPTNVNILEKYKSDLAQELQSLKKEYNLSKKQQKKLEKRYQSLEPLPNKDQYGRPIFKSQNQGNSLRDLDQELDQELSTLSETMNIPLAELQKKQAKITNQNPNIAPKPEVKTSYSQSPKQKAEGEMQILEAKIALAKIEAQKAEAEAAKAQAEAEREYYKTQTIRLDQLKAHKWWKKKPKKSQKKHP